MTRAGYILGRSLVCPTLVLFVALTWDVSDLFGQNGIILPGLGENAQNIDVTEDGTNPVGQPANETAIVTIGFDLNDMPITPQQGTEGEAVGNLINDLVVFDQNPPNLTKWNDLQGDTMMMPVHITLDQPRAVNYYTITSANDSPERDPHRWRLLGSTLANPTSVADFTLVETSDDFPGFSRDGVEYANRHETQLFGPIGNTDEYLTYRFEFETEWVAHMTGTTPNSIQAAEIELFEDFAFAGPKVTVDRSTGQVTLANRGNSAFNMTGYSITSASGSLNSSAGGWKSITDTYDGDNGGGVDDDNWIRLTAADGRNDIGEVEVPDGDGATVMVSQEIDLGTAWIRNPTEDLVGEILLADGSTEPLSIDFTGGPGAAYAFGNLTFDASNTINFLDWATFKNNQGFDFSTVFSTAESYAHGDLDGDFDQDLDDFRLFKSAFEAANGAGSFVAMLASVPEPGTAALIGLGAVVLGCGTLRRRCFRLLLLAGIAVAFLSGRAALAGEVLPGLIGNDLTNVDELSPADVVVFGGSTSPAAETPPNVVDNTTDTKWLAFDGAGTFLDIRFKQNGRSAVNEYTITSANDFEERDPYSWTLQGSNDGNNFTTLDTQTAQDFGARFETQKFTFTNNDAYNVYRFNFQTDFGAGVPDVTDPGSVQLSEVELFGTDVVPNVLTLQVDATTGDITFANNNNFGDDVPISLDAYRIRSDAGSLNRDNWWGDGAGGSANGGQSLRDQNLVGFPGSSGNGAGWEEGPGSTDNELVEWLLGSGGVNSSALAEGQSITMENIFRPGSAQDLTFEYNDGIYVVQGDVEYIGAPVIPGDYDNSGQVAQGDLDLVLLNWGKTVPPDPVPEGWINQQPSGLIGQGALDGVLLNWGGLSSTASVPEPATVWLLAIVVPGLVLSLRRSHRVRSRVQCRTLDDSQLDPRRSAMAQRLMYASCARLVVLAVVCLAIGRVSYAVSTLDRNYRFGDDGQEHATVGQIVGSGAGNVSPNKTLDSASQGSFFDLEQFGNSIYADVQATGRPGAPAGEKGIEFNGANSQYLQGSGLGSPREGNPMANPPTTDYPNSRIMQIWVRPTLDTGARQDVVNDTFQFGIHITADDTWGHTYGPAVDDPAIGGDYDTGTPVAYNEWTHIMQRTYDNDGVAVFVNGVAVSRFDATYTEDTAGAGDLNMYVGAATGATSGFFTGQLDGLKVAVAGSYIPPPPATPIPVEWGTFDFGAENDYVASLGLVDGDVNGDGMVKGDGTGDTATDDVSFFIAHWLDEQLVNGFVIGDLTSRTTMADLNYDGRTSLADWQILRSHHGGGASLNLGALLAGVPEPTTAALLAMAIFSFGGVFGGRRRRAS
jgi:hypothetical protein